MTARLVGAFDAAQTFSLTEYDRILYVDSDILFLQNIDSLFTKKKIPPILSAVFHNAALKMALKTQKTHSRQAACRPGLFFSYRQSEATLV